ncbi:MAG: hypothetical protein ACLVJ6_10615 [Merdibacter sp.]
MREDVNPEKIGIIGICGWGGMALNAAALDTRIKATVASTMYDMARVNANGYFDAEDSEAARYEKKKALNAQRIEDCRNGAHALGGGVAAAPDALLCQRLSRLLQDGSRLSSTFFEFQRRVECDRYDVFYESAYPSLQ